MNLAEFEIPLVSFIFLILLDIIYFSKNRIKLTENKYYDAILVFSTIMSFLDTAIHIMCSFYTYDILATVYYPLINVANKMFSLLFSIIFTLFLGYILLITYEKIRQNKEKLLKWIIAFNLIILIILQFTSIDITTTQNVTNVKGLTLDIGYFIVALSIITSLIIALKRIRKLDKRYIAIFSMVLVIMILYPITIIFKGFIIYDLILALLCYIMYFTIENPDLRMIEEVSDAKTKAEKYNNDKSIFIFNITQQLRYPLNVIEQRCEQLTELNNSEISDIVSDIKFSSQKINSLLNGTMNIDVIDVNKVKIYDTKYKLKNIIEKSIIVNEKKITGKNLEFIKNISESLPEELYGDSIRLKQIIESIISNSIKYTEKGYIEFAINSVIKENICRLILSFKDSGKGMKAEEIDRIMNNKSEDFIDKTNKEDLTLTTAKKLVNMIGGTMTINSEPNVGTEVIVYIDQRISSEDKNLDTIVNEYNTSIKKKTILIISPQSEKYQKRLNKEFIVNTASSGEKGLNLIRNNKVYDMILIEEKMDILSGIQTYEKLSSIEEFNTPVLLITENSNLKERYLKLGFNDIIAEESEIIDKIKSNLE